MAYIDKYGVEYSDDKKTIVLCPTELTGSYTIMEGVERIDSMAFAGSNLQTIIIPSSVRIIGDLAFADNKFLSEIIIPEGVVRIGHTAFYCCESLRLVHISSSVTEIGNCVFNSCYQLKAINVDVSNANYVSVDGILFNKNKTKLILCPPMCISTSYVVPPHIEEIETAAFWGCTKLKKIKLPNSVKKYRQ